MQKSAETKNVPERMCICCRRILPRNLLLRLVRPTGKNQLKPDPTGRICGKGYYICRKDECLQKLQTNKKLRKVFSSTINSDVLNWMADQLKGSETLTEETVSACELKDVVFDEQQQ